MQIEAWAAVSEISVRWARPRFNIFKSDEEGRPINATILAPDELREILAFTKRPNWNCVFEYHHGFYSYSEFKRFVEAGDMVRNLDSARSVHDVLEADS